MKVKQKREILLDTDIPVYDIVNSGSEHNFIIHGKSCNIVSHNCTHGTMSKSDRDFYYIPEGNQIDITYGSSSTHALGSQTYVGYCLVGDTKILYDNKVSTLSDLCENNIVSHVCSYDSTECSLIESANSGVTLTKYTQDTIKIELEDGTVIEGTPEHRIMLSDGSYKQLKDLTEDDDIMVVEQEIFKDVKVVVSR